MLVPVKAFSHAKARLAGHLSDTERAALARRMAERVLAAARPLPAAVVCDDPEVRDWAVGVGAEVIWRPDHGLNGAVGSGVATLGQRGFDQVVVAHADLPLATELAWVADFDGVTIIPDRHDDGTNVIAVPSGAGFGFAYGPGSFGRHAGEAQRLGLALRVVRDPLLGWDVDRPDDLTVLEALPPTCR